MNLRDLTYVLAVAELGHFGRAAEACRVSQPTLSGQILKLEEELGTRIFERDGRKVRPTPSGEQIIARAQTIVATAEEIVVIGKASRDPLDGPIRLGMIPTLAPYLLPHVLPSLARALPKVRLALTEDMTANLLDGLAAGRLDAIVIATDPNRERLVELLLFDEDFWVAAPAGHPLAARASVIAADLDPSALLLLADGHCLRGQALDFCGRANVGSGTGADVRAASLETLLHLTAANQGVTLVPRLAVDPDGMRSNLVARPLLGPGQSRRIRLFYRVNSPRAAAMEPLAAALRRGLPDCVAVLS